MSKISAKEIQPKIRGLIGKAERLEPALANRLREIEKWIKDKPPGLLTRKKVLLNFLIEIIVDASQWLEFCEMPIDEQEIESNYLSAVEKLWYCTLFPRWFNEPDPKLDKWKGEILQNDYKRKDEAQISQLTRSISSCGGQAHQNMILDFSMATDLMVSCPLSLRRVLCVQLTISDQRNTKEKICFWRHTINYWKIERALFISFHPCGQYRSSRELAVRLIDENKRQPVHGCQNTLFV
jgi:hypothetical protein